MPFSKEDESPLENCIYCWFLEYSELLIQRHNEKKKKNLSSDSFFNKN